MIFVGGLHRSGTTLLADLLADHPAIGGLRDTGVPHDEGQHLQDVVPTAMDLGGPGAFAGAPGAHLTETDAAALDDPGGRMLASWLPSVDAGREVVVEKSPPNLLRFRFLQAAFPGARCIAIVRHPVAVSFATEFWADADPFALVAHWLRAHETFEADRRHIEHLHFLRYEDLVADPETHLRQIHEFVGVDPIPPSRPVERTTNERYFARYRHHRLLPARWKTARYVRRYEARLRALGYGYTLKV
jgi:hypothetical protein